MTGRVRGRESDFRQYKEWLHYLRNSTILCFFNTHVRHFQTTACLFEKVHKVPQRPCEERSWRQDEDREKSRRERGGERERNEKVEGARQ